MVVVVVVVVVVVAVVVVCGFAVLAVGGFVVEINTSFLGDRARVSETSLAVIGFCCVDVDVDVAVVVVVGFVVK